MAATQGRNEPPPQWPGGLGAMHGQRLQEHHEPANLPRHFDRRPATQMFSLSVTGAHGGAGTTTVARLLNIVDMGPLWPVPSRGMPCYVLVAARTNAAGLDAASRMLASYRGRRYPQDSFLLGVVLMADAPGRLPKAISRSITILSSAVPVTRVPWVCPWRIGEITTYEQKLAAGLQQFIGDARTRMGDSHA